MPDKIDFLPADIHDVWAIQSLSRGEADAHMQKRVLNCIIRELCGTYEMTFDPESQRLSDFNEGKRHIGRCLVGLVNLPPEVVQKGYAAIQKRTQAVSTINKKGRR